jgi:pentatricopeptide repeat protein
VCAARGAFNAALGLVDRMCADGPKPTVVTYNVLLRGAIGAGQLENAAKILDQMPKLGATRRPPPAAAARRRPQGAAGRPRARRLQQLTDTYGSQR